MGSPPVDPTSVQKICNLTDDAGIVESTLRWARTCTFCRHHCRPYYTHAQPSVQVSASPSNEPSTCSTPAAESQQNTFQMSPSPGTAPGKYNSDKSMPAEYTRTDA